MLPTRFINRGDYLSAKELKKKSSRQGALLLIVFIGIFIAVIFRFAIRTGANEGFFTMMPTGDDAYKVAAGFIRPTVHSAIDFPDNDFEYSKNSDSVYVVQSWYNMTDPRGNDVKTNFTITLRYNGGSSSDSQNWAMVNYQEK